LGEGSRKRGGREGERKVERGERERKRKGRKGGEGEGRGKGWPSKRPTWIRHCTR